MKKSKPTPKIKRIQDFLSGIEWAFELNNWEKTITKIENQPEEHPYLTAEVIPDMIYREITIKLYPRFWECDADVQRKALLHELVHILLQNTKLFATEMLDGNLHTKQEIINENENTTTKITHLLDCLLVGNLKYARIAYKKYLKK